MIVAKKIVLILIVSLFCNCKSFKVVAYQKPMSNLELARYIRLIEHRRVISLENYLYRYGINRPFFYRDFYLQPINYNYSYKPSFRNNTNINIPRTGTVGNTITMPNVQTPIPKGNIKTKQ